MSRKHPLSEDEEWYFAQHFVKVHAPFYRNAGEEASRGTHSRVMYANGEDSCREGVISHIRSDLTEAAGKLIQDPKECWRRKWVRHSTLDADHPSLRKPGESYIAVSSAHITQSRMVANPDYWPPEKRAEERAKAKRRDAARRRQGLWSYGPLHDYRDHTVERRRVHKPIKLTVGMITDFLDVCDALVGPITVLLNPDRYQGNWWYTGNWDCLHNSDSRNQESQMLKTGMLRWYGVDNTCIQHPALTSLYAGLVRQCAYIARTGCVDQVREDVEGLGLKECLTDSDDVAARKIVQKMRKWIAVPVMKGGHPSHVPVAIGSFPKVMALHKAIYQHGFRKTFAKSFTDGWAIGSLWGAARGQKRYNGIHTFMGRKGENPQGQRIKKLAASKAA